MPLTTTGSVGSRTDSYAYGTEKKSMPYGKRQAKAVLANTSETNPRHKGARIHAKMALRKKKRMNGLMPTKKMR